MLINMGNGTYLRITAGDLLALILMIALAVCVVVAYFMAISCMVKAARAKSDRFSAGKLWFIGLFTTPIILGLICCALKDEKSPAAKPAILPASAQPVPAAQPAAAVAAQPDATAAAPASQPSSAE